MANFTLPTNAGGRWNRSAQAHVFAGDPRPKLGLMLETGVAVDEQKKFQAFYTPPELAGPVDHPALIMKTQKEILKWLQANCGKSCIGALTSTDVYALVTSVNLTNLISYESAPDELFAAYRAIVMQMQQQTRWMAYHAIAMELDWSHRNMIWTNADLPDGDKPAHKCTFE